MAHFPATPVRCNFVHIILMEANGDLSPRDIPSLERLMHLCLKGDIAELESLADESNRSRAAAAARFILRKHRFEVDKARNLEILKSELHRAVPRAA